MKLIYCPHCRDVFSLPRGIAYKYCSCMRSNGKYETDGVNAHIRGDAIPLGFDNQSFAEAIENRPYGGIGAYTGGWRFTAFVMPRRAPTINGGRET